MLCKPLCYINNGWTFSRQTSYMYKVGTPIPCYYDHCLLVAHPWALGWWVPPGSSPHPWTISVQFPCGAAGEAGAGMLLKPSICLPPFPALLFPCLHGRCLLRALPQEPFRVSAATESNPRQNTPMYYLHKNFDQQLSSKHISND